MKEDSLINRYQVFTSAACIAVHSNNTAQGFRQSDLKFFIELFSNWCESSLEDKTLKIQNTQIKRYLEKLLAEGYARKLIRKKSPIYRLTRIGLIELLTKLVTAPYYTKKDHFFFAVYFIKNYKVRLEQLVKEEGAQYPSSLRIELDSLLNVERFINQEKTFIKTEIKKLKARIDDAYKTSAFVKDNSNKNLKLSDIIKQIEKLYPYELNSQKPLSELINQIPEQQRVWELINGNIKRCEDIWNPCLKQLEEYYKILDTVDYEQC